MKSSCFCLCCYGIACISMLYSCGGLLCSACILISLSRYFPVRAMTQLIKPSFVTVCGTLGHICIHTTNVMWSTASQTTTECGLSEWITIVFLRHIGPHLHQYLVLSTYNHITWDTYACCEWGLRAHGSNPKPAGQIWPMASFHLAHVNLLKIIPKRLVEHNVFMPLRIHSRSVA